MRPVLITSLTVIAAMLPAAIGLGPGVETNRPLALVVMGGMVSSTLLTLVVVPAVYSWSKKRWRAGTPGLAAPHGCGSGYAPGARVWDGAGMKRRFWLSALLLAAAPASAEDLIEVYRQVQANDPVWAAALPNYEANIEKLPQGRAQILPTVNFSAGTTDTDLRSEEANRRRTLSLRHRYYSLNLTQPLYRRQNTAAYAQGEHQATQAEHEFLGARHDLMLRAAQTYFNVLAAQDVYDCNVREKTVIERLLTLARATFSVKLRAWWTCTRPSAARRGTRPGDRRRHRPRRQTRGAARLTARNPACWRASKRLAPQAPDRRARKNGPSARSPRTPWSGARRGARAARRELEKNRAGHHRRSTSPPRTATPTPAATRPGPIAINARTRWASCSPCRSTRAAQLPQGARDRRAARRADRRLEQARREAAQQARQHYLAALNGIARIQALEQALASSQRALETTLLGYERGQRTGVDVLNAARALPHPPRPDGGALRVP